MSEDYQVLTYRVQRNEGRQKLQRVVIDADAHRVDLRGELRLTEEVVAVDPKEMKEYKVTLSPASLDTETLPVVVGVLPESQFCLDALPAPGMGMDLDVPSPFSSSSSSWTLGFCSRPTRCVQVEEPENTAFEAQAVAPEMLAVTDAQQDETLHTLEGSISHEDLMAAAQALREEEVSATSSYDQLEQAEADPEADARHEARMAMLAWSELQPQGTAHVHRPSWEELNLREEEPPRPRRNQQHVTSALLLLAGLCASALMWSVYIAN